jgi:son of sevenless-like protein
MNNFHGCLAVISGLSRCHVTRMKKSWELISTKECNLFEQLGEFTSMVKNYSTMRVHLKTVTPPLIPYLGIYLSDLLFSNEGNPDELDGILLL